jgi:cytochrome oxidase Cu insertion factor (SCO1/SenC/PrrC family)
MRLRYFLSVSLAALLFFAVLPEARAIGVGDPAPDFELDSTKGGKLKLSNLKGKSVLINFYVFDFSAT